MPKYTILHNDSLVALPSLPENSIDSIVTDPPYGWTFRGSNWDHGVPGPQFWKEALRVAKPGTFLLAFGGPRTFHRLTVAIEDAGWEIRDVCGWIFSSGFPKSHNISKAIDKHQKTLQSQKYSGYGTALKPAWEPIIVARKPLEGTNAENVLKYGTGGLNIDGCRVGTEERVNPPGGVCSGPSFGKREVDPEQEGRTVQGRFPANLITSYNEDTYQLKDLKHCPKLLKELKDWMNENT